MVRSKSYHVMYSIMCICVLQWISKKKQKHYLLMYSECKYVNTHVVTVFLYSYESNFI